MAAPALFVKGIGQEGALPFALLSFVAFLAEGRGLPLLVNVVMALRALETDSLIRGVLFVIKKHVSGDVLEHDPDRDLRRLVWVSGIQNHPHQEKDSRRGVGQVTFPFPFHSCSSSGRGMESTWDRRALRMPPLTKVE
jgi:hypothetical protein